MERSRVVSRSDKVSFAERVGVRPVVRDAESLVYEIVEGTSEGGTGAR